MTTQQFDPYDERPAQPSADSSDASGRERRADFSKFTWRYLEGDEIDRLWDELLDWVWWLRDRYELDAALPDCWFRHGPIVEELTAAMSAWTEAYTDNGTGAALSNWHSQTLWPLVERIERTRQFHNCSRDTCTHSSGLMHAPTGTENLMAPEPVSAEDSDLAVVVRILGQEEMHAAEAKGRAALIGSRDDSRRRYRLHGHTWAWSGMLDAYVPVPDPVPTLHALPSPGA